MILQNRRSSLGPPRDCPDAHRSVRRYMQTSLWIKSEQNLCIVLARVSHSVGLCPLSLQKSCWRPEQEGRGLCRWLKGISKELLSPITQRRKCHPEPPASGQLCELCITLNCSDEHVLEVSARSPWAGAGGCFWPSQLYSCFLPLLMVHFTFSVRPVGALQVQLPSPILMCCIYQGKT